LGAFKLYEVYDSPNDIDLFIAGLADDHLIGAHVGTSFGSLIADQFLHLKFGDQFFFTHNPLSNRSTFTGNTKMNNPHPFNSDQLANLKVRNLGNIMCDNTRLQMPRENVFVQTSPELDCKSNSKLNLRRF
jgi:hypothetical protein